MAIHSQNNGPEPEEHTTMDSMENPTLDSMENPTMELIANGTQIVKHPAAFVNGGGQ